MGPTGPQTHSATTAFVLAPIVLPLPILTSRSAVRLLVRSIRAPGRLEREYQDRSSEGAPLGNLEALEKAVWREVYERDLSQSRSRHGSGQHGRHDGIDTNTHSSGSAATVGEESQCQKQICLFHARAKSHERKLAKLPTPPATTTHIPIPHAAVVETLVENLESRSHWRRRRGVRSVHGRHGECSASSIWRQALTATVSRSELETRIPHLQPKDDAASAAASAAPLTRA